MNNTPLAFSKMNYILLAVGCTIIIVGFFLMSGPGTTEQHFETDIFSDTRIRVAPVVCLFGFLFNVVAILWKSK